MQYLLPGEKETLRGFRRNDTSELLAFFVNVYLNYFLFKKKNMAK